MMEGNDIDPDKEQAQAEAGGDVEAQQQPQDDAKLQPVEEAAMDEKRNGLRMETWGVLGACGIMGALYLVAMALFYSTVPVLAAGVVAILVGANVAKHQYYDLEEMDTLRTTHNKLRQDVNDFSEENKKLALSNDRLEEEIAPLKESEKKLAEIAEQQGADIEKLKNLVKDNQETLNQMHEAQKQDVVHSMMQILMEVDRDEDGELSDRETKRLLSKMKNLPTIEFHEENFGSKLEENRRVSYFLDLVHQITDDSIPEKERLFTISQTKKMDAVAEDEEE